MGKWEGEFACQAEKVRRICHLHFSSTRDCVSWRAKCHFMLSEKVERMHTPPVPPLNTEAIRFLSLRPVSNGPQQCRIAIRMDVSRNVTKTVASRSANWTASIIRTTGTTSPTFSHSAQLFNNRGISTLPSNVRRCRHNLISSNAGYKVINTTFCRRGLQTNASTEGTPQGTQVSHYNILISLHYRLTHCSRHRKIKISTIQLAVQRIHGHSRKPRNLRECQSVSDFASGKLKTLPPRPQSFPLIMIMPHTDKFPTYTLDQSKGIGSERLTTGNSLKIHLCLCSREMIWWALGASDHSCYEETLLSYG